MRDGCSKNGFKNNLFNSFKKKLLDFAIEYLKNSFKANSKDFANYVEKHIVRAIEVKVKREIRRQTLKLSGYTLVGIGGCFIIYFILDLIVLLLELPIMFTNLLFGLFLMLFGIVLFLSM